MRGIKRVNSSVFKADLKKYREEVKAGNLLILQEHNVDQVAVIPLELLNQAEDLKARKERATK